MGVKFIFTIISILHSIGILAQTHNWVRTNPGGGGAFSTIDQGPPAANGAGQIIAGSDLSGAYYSWDGGQSWGVYGSSRGLTATHISGIGFHPSNADVFFLAADGGVFKSSNGGGYLYQVLNGGYNTDVKVAPSNNAIVYVSYHPAYNSAQGKVYKSTDGGESFSQVSNTTLPSGIHILKLLVHKLDDNTIFAVTGKGRFAEGPEKLYRSIDGGINWIDISPTADGVMDATIDPDNADIIYTSTMQDIIDGNGICTAGNKGHLYRSTDKGTNWGAGPIANYTGVILIPSDNNQTIRLIDPRCPYEWYSDSGTWTSTDYGVSWSRTGDPTNWDKAYQANTSTVWSYGESYNGLCKTIGGSLTEPDAAYWTNVQWAFGSTNGGETFNNLHTNEINTNTWQSTGFDNVVMLDIDINESNNDEMYITFADIGLWRSQDGGLSWQMTNDAAFTGNWDGNGGNTRSVLCDPSRVGKVWATQQGDANQQAYLISSDQAGAPGTWTDNSTGIQTGTFMLGLSLDRTSPITNRTLFVTQEGDVYKSQNDGVSWSKVLTNGSLYFTAVDHFDGQLVYAGGAAGLYKSINGGTDWTKVLDTPSNPGSQSSPYGEEYAGISDIETDPNLQGEILISMYGANGGGIYKSLDAGANWSMVYDNPFMRSISIYASDSDIIYAGSSYAFYQGFYNSESKGVLMTNDGGTNWMEVNDGMPWTTAVTMDISNGSQPTIFAGITGTGFQRATLPNTTSASILTAQNLIELHPNPFTDKVIVSGDFTNFQIKIFDAFGQLVSDHTGTSSPFTINLSELGAGMYFLSIASSVHPQLSIHKIIKEN